MNTIVIDEEDKIADIVFNTELYHINFPENFIFQKFKLMFPQSQKAVIVEFGDTTKTGNAKIFCNLVKRKDFVKWNFEDFKYDEEEVYGKKNQCISAMKNILNEQDKYCYFMEVLYIITICNYIMTAQRDRVYKTKGISEIKNENKSGKKKTVSRKIYLLDEIVEYVNENGLSKNYTGKEIQCPCWSVRGHYRHYKNGKVIFIQNYKKGKERDKIEPKNKTYTV